MTAAQTRGPIHKTSPLLLTDRKTLYTAEPSRFVRFQCGTEPHVCAGGCGNFIKGDPQRHQITCSPDCRRRVRGGKANRRRLGLGRKRAA